MITTTVDIIVRRWLLERNLPIHYYLEGLFHASSCVRELTSDTLQIINSANLPVGDDGSVDLPMDFLDDLALCVPVEGALAPLPKQDWITPLRIHDTTSGQFVAPYTTTTSNAVNLFFGFPAAWQYYWNVNDYGESTGRRFGSHGGTRQGYKVIREQRRIQMSDSFSGSSVVLLYLGDGQSADNASQIDTRAMRTVHAWIDWQSSPSRVSNVSYEAKTFYNEKRRLRTLLNPITRTDIINTLRESYTAGIKF